MKNIWILCLSSIPILAHADFRCSSENGVNSYVIEVGDTQARVLSRCGKPDLVVKAGSIERKVTSTHAMASEDIDTMTEIRPIEKWTYTKKGALTRELVFEAGYITKINILN